MKPLMHPLSVVRLVPLFFFAMAANLTAQESDLELPDDLREPVIVMDYVGGFRRPDPPGFVRTPFVSIYADGRVLTGRNAPEQEVYEFRLDADELEELVKFIVTEQKFFEQDSNALKDRIEQVPDRMIVMDAPSTRITLRTRQKTHMVDVYALAMVARQLASIDGLQRLHAIEQRLKAVQTLAALGRDVAERVVNQVNEFLAENDRRLPHDLTWRDLAWFASSPLSTRTGLTRGPTDSHGPFSITIELDGNRNIKSINVQKQ